MLGEGEYGRAYMKGDRTAMAALKPKRQALMKIGAAPLEEGGGGNADLDRPMLWTAAQHCTDGIILPWSATVARRKAIHVEGL